MRDESGKRIACIKCFHFRPFDPAAYDGTCSRVVQNIRLASGDMVKVKGGWFCGYFEPVQFENLYKFQRKQEWTDEDEQALQRHKAKKEAEKCNRPT